MRWLGALRDRFSRCVISAGLLVAAVIVLLWPVHLSAYDRWGFQISCGTGLAANDEQAAHTDSDAQPPSTRIGQCHSAIAWGRAQAGALALLGGGGLLTLIPRPRTRRLDRADANSTDINRENTRPYGDMA